jgi:AraC-like DNA-binding protein
LNKIVYPEYQEHILGLEPIPGGRQRFYVDIQTMAYSKLHHHDYAELSFFVDGTGYEFINGIGHRLQSGTASFILPHQIHVIHNAPNQPVRKYRCMFDFSLLNDMCGNPDISRLLYSVGSTLPSFVDLHGYLEERMKAVFEQLHHEYTLSDSPVHQAMIGLKLREAVLWFIRAASETPLDFAQYEREDHSEFWDILHYVHTHCSDNLSLEELSHQFHYSVQHISRSFKDRTGKGFLDYVHELRINSAITMLIHTNMPITEIAVAAGFDSFRTFARVFRQIKGQTASEFRNSIRPGTDHDRNR